MHLPAIVDALQPLIDGEPNVDDLRSLERVHAFMGRRDAAAAARARSEESSTPIRTLATHMRRQHCTAPRDVEAAEDDEYDEPERHCDFEVIADLRLESEPRRGVGVVRTITGLEAAEAILLFVTGGQSWFEEATISDGPFVGNQTHGVTRIHISDVRLVDVDGAAPAELAMRYERERIDDAEETADAGVVLCRVPASGGESRCVFLPERIARTVDGRERASEYSVELGAGGVRVSRVRGRTDPEARVGRFTLDAILTAPEG